ncbi:MAG: threonylcarbamoyl-AMP synthase [Methylotenera sp.]|nr:threonylcarbamoyl-AMP synthase [Oligoflexia bacterium]
MKAEILGTTSKAIAKAAALLQAGEVVGMPTETVYGLAGCAFNSSALAKIFETKERPTFDPLICHVDASVQNLADLEAIGLVNPAALSRVAQARVESLMYRFWPGPLTLVLPRHARVPDLVTGGLDTVGVRMPRHSAAQALIAAAGFPLAAPSANRFGRISPTTAQAVFSELGDRIPMILDGGACEVGLESTVLLVNAEGELTLLRPGGISETQIEEVAHASVIRATSPDAALKKSAELAPGMLDSHYAPSKKLYQLEASVSELNKLEVVGLETAALPESLGLLMLSGSAFEGTSKFEALTGRKVIAFTLSESGNWSEAAQNLFSTLRRLDESPALVLFCEPCLETTGIGHAIADRLKRASHGSKQVAEVAHNR